MSSGNKRSSGSTSVFDELPDDLLPVIVSLLPFDEAARTSVLAKRWKNLWRSTTNIEIDTKFFVKEPLSVLIPRDGLNAVTARFKQVIPRFADFAAKFLNSYKGKEINSFSLRVGDASPLLQKLVPHYITFAVKRHVKHLTVDLTQSTWRQNPQSFRPPPPIVSMSRRFYEQCAEYESLNLSVVKVDQLSDCTNFAALRRASLSWIEIKDENLTHLVRKSPLLEELRLVKCWGFDVDIQSDSLTTLVVDKCDLDENAISVVAPNLKVFMYSGSFGDINFHNAVGYLEEVYIDYDLEEDFQHCWDHIYYQLLQFKGVRLIQVCSFVLQILPFCVGDLPLNPNHLMIKTASFHPNDFHGLSFFLESCKAVEKLTIDISNRRLLNDYEFPLRLNPDIFWSVKNSKSITCLEKTLKVVEVKGFNGAEHVVQFLQLLMLKGKVLEKIILIKKDGAQEELAAANQLLLNSGRVSEQLEIHEI